MAFIAKDNKQVFDGNLLVASTLFAGFSFQRHAKAVAINAHRH